MRIVSCWLVTVLMSNIGRADDGARIEFFESRIRPVLVKHCYKCHSAESKPIQGGLRLDAADVLKQGGDSGTPIHPGKPNQSLLIEAIKWESLEMPPNRRLPANVIKDFQKWVADGALDPRVNKSKSTAAPAIEKRITEAKTQWAYQQPKRWPIPNAPSTDIAATRWARNWVDRFLQDKWKKSKLNPVEDADRATLARRLYYDLTGLPPSRDELQAFLDDDRPQAFELLIERLLASPGFGEHWGRMWMDVARYADSNGGDFNATFHEAWRYRNYVIDAFNSDKPYDEFTREQIAGDLLPFESPAERTNQVVATAFLMLGPKMLSERDKEKLRMDVVDEQIDSMGRAFLGLTLGCARCHDHKFDPIPTRDYYALAGIFRSTKTLNGEIQKYVSNWVRQPLPVDESRRKQFEQHQQQTKAVSELLKTTKKANDDLKKQVQQLEAENQSGRLVVDDSNAEKHGLWQPSKLSSPFFGEGYIHDQNKRKGERSVKFTRDLPASGVYEVRIAYNHHRSRAAKVPVLVEHADGESKLFLNQQKKPAYGPFQAVGKFAFSATAPAKVTLFNRGTSGFVIVDAVEFVPIDVADLPEVETKRTAPMLLAAREKLTQSTKQLKALEAKQAKLKANAPAALPRALAAVEAEDAGDCRICIRGEHANLGKPAPRGFLQVASREKPQFSEQQSGRRELAEWLSSEHNPLTARVMANRIWRRLMGEGIVRSMDNFGQLGEPPSHPELLDSLAVEFVANQWSVKHLVRLIATSRAYRMSSRTESANQKADPENRLFWRAHRKNISAESIRDAMLKVGGRLDRSTSDSPVAGLGTLVTQNKADDKGYQGSSSTRRTIYSAIIRNELPPMLTLFDFADPDFVIGKRSTTTTPAQSLLMLNSPFVRQSATQAVVALVQSRDERQAVEALYLSLLSRRPTTTETNRALEFIRVAKMEADQTDAKRNAASKSTSDKTAPEKSSPTKTASAEQDNTKANEAWVQLAHALLASTEFRMLD